MEQIKRMRENAMMADAMMRKSMEEGNFDMALIYAKYAADIEQKLFSAKIGY